MAYISATTELQQIIFKCSLSDECLKMGGEFSPELLFKTLIGKHSVWRITLRSHVGSVWDEYSYAHREWNSSS